LGRVATLIRSACTVIARRLPEAER
jgi:hypothetical protein